MNVYVYYDVPLTAVDATAARVRTMQSALERHAARVALLRRPDSKASSQTWMEVYEGVTPDFEAQLARAAQAHGLDEATGPRHVERFEPID